MQGPLVKLIDAFKWSYPSHFKVLWNIGESILRINPSTHHAHQANECHCKLQAHNWQSKSNCHEDQDQKISKALETLDRSNMVQSQMSRQICPNFSRWPSVFREVPLRAANQSLTLESRHMPWDNQDVFRIFDHRIISNPSAQIHPIHQLYFLCLTLLTIIHACTYLYNLYSMNDYNIL
jgi:hypothetical protein